MKMKKERKKERKIEIVRGEEGRESKSRDSPDFAWPELPRLSLQLLYRLYRYLYCSNSQL